MRTRNRVLISSGSRRRTELEGMVDDSVWDAHKVITRYDDFDRADSVLSSSATLPSGQTYNIGFAGGAVDSELKIVSSNLVLESDGASYISTRVANDVPDKVELTAKFSPGISTLITQCVALIVSKQTGVGLIVAQWSCHLVFNTRVWALSFYDGVTHPAVKSVPFSPSLSTDTEYTIGMRRIAKDQILIVPPQGKTVIVQSPYVDQLWGATVLMEHYQPLAEYVGGYQIPTITRYEVSHA